MRQKSLNVIVNKSFFNYDLIVYAIYLAIHY